MYVPEKQIAEKTLRSTYYVFHPCHFLKLVINFRSPAPCAFSTKCSLTPERGKKVKTTHQTESGGGEGSRLRGMCWKQLSAWLVRGGEGEGMKEKKRPSGKSGTRTSGPSWGIRQVKSRRVGSARVLKAAQAAEEGFQELVRLGGGPCWGGRGAKNPRCEVASLYLHFAPVCLCHAGSHDSPCGRPLF